ncbi:MAG: hypothetical protein D6785_05055, partial [Planctomycetota bacterium]
MTKALKDDIIKVLVSEYLEGIGMEDSRLAEILLEKKLITPPQLMNARNLQKATGGTLQQLVVKLNYIKQDQLNALIAEEENLHTVEIDLKRIHLKAMKKIPRKIIEKYHILPLISEDEEELIILAMEDPNNYQPVEEVQFLTGMRVEPALASREGITKALNYYYNHPVEVENLAKLDSASSNLNISMKLDQLFQDHNLKEILK